MARTYAQIRQLTVQQTGLRRFSGTADAGGSTAILRDAALARYSEDYWNGHHLLLTSGSPAFTELFIHDFIQIDGDVRFRPNLSAAPNSLTYEILPFSGTAVREAVQDSILELYDRGLLSRDFWMIMVGGSPIFNADFGEWSSATQPVGWTITTSTAARERASANLTLSETSLALTTASGFASLNPQYVRYLSDVKGETITYYCWVLTSTTSNARIAWNDGTTINYSAYHGGDGDWELLHVQVETSNADTNAQPRLYIDNAATAYFNMPYVLGGEYVRTYPFSHVLMPDGPYEILESDLGILRDEIATERGLAQVRQVHASRSITDYRTTKHHDQDSTSQIGTLDFALSRRPPREGRLLRLRGDGPLTVPTTALSTSNIEVTESESLLLATLAAIKLLDRAAAGAPGSTRRMYAEHAAELQQQFAWLSIGAGESRSVATYNIGW
jgi:hypothetical protein